MRSVEWRYFQWPCVTPGHPQITQFSTFCNAFHISITGEVRHFKFGWLAYHSMSHPVGDKPSLKGAWSGSREWRDQLENFTPHEISSEWLKLQTSNFVHDLATRSANLQMTNCPLRGRGQRHVTHSRIAHPLKYLWNCWG